jgi:hypothetical protein
MSPAGIATERGKNSIVTEKIASVTSWRIWMIVSLRALKSWQIREYQAVSNMRDQSLEPFVSPDEVH